MYLKSIELNGFKSFANKIELKFEKGITAIVGPNGSGKSNVADAVRWVLGEQSAMRLRGSKMEDVIFAGTEQRKPQGSAYVAITLDNSDHSLPTDYTEVTVARRVYRSGESEYLINGTVSRLRDVTNLFMDTGIGKEGYSIIGQGQIERILSEKAEDRRALFDEAAGIVKYKKNKALTEKQLEEEHGNLARVNDILSGLEDRVEPLRLQSEKAKQYLDLRESLKRTEIRGYLSNLAEISGKMEKSRDNLEIVNGDISRLKEEFDHTRAEYDRLSQQVEDLGRKIDADKALVTEKTLASEHADGEIRVLRERMLSREEKEKETSRQLKELEQQITDLSSEIRTAEEEQQKTKDSATEKDQILASARQKNEVLEREIHTLEEKIRDANSSILTATDEGAKIREKTGRYDAMLENINLRKTQLKARYLQDKSDLDTCGEQKKVLDQQMQSVTETLSENRKAFAALETEIRNAAEKENRLQNESVKANQQLISLRSRQENLRNLAERYDGYGSSIRRVMEQKKHVPGLVGVVADIIETDPEYETAIETALGGSIQNIVTRDEETAKQMISYLRKNRFGRATFLPITSVRAHGSVNGEALREPGVIGLASGLVRTENRFRGIIDSLLGRSIVVSDIDTAIRIARKYHQSLRLVTPAGELINPGGAMTGGAFRNSSNLLGRKRELEEIASEIEKTSAALSKAGKELQEIKMKRESLKEDRTRRDSEIRRLSLDENSTALKLKNLEDRMKRLEADFQNLQKENAGIEKQISEIRQNQASLSSTGHETEDSIRKAREEMDELQQDLTKKRTEKQSADENLTSAVLQQNEIRQKISFAASNLERLQQDLENKNKDLLSGQRSLQESRNELKNLQEEIRRLEEEKKKAEEEAAEHAASAASSQQEKEKIAESNKGFFDKREKLSADISGLEKDALRLQLEIQGQQNEKDAQANYMWDEYQLTREGARKLADETDDRSPARLKKDAQDLKKEIRGLGDVNVNAIDEYKQVKEQYDFLSGQRNDILEAEENLRKIISDLDQGMKKTFAEKFHEIQVMFSKVFRELFGGGRAALSLVDEDNLLETGIVISAEPPGKKLQNMMQLSGGEKSLTAISLLFAIQSLKPSPFCILDEIEAALDDSNVSRFARYLNKLTNHTQFIVITHRKGTMEEADVLYGITMQEKGVSTLVSVNLIEDQLEGEE